VEVERLTMAECFGHRIDLLRMCAA